MEDMSKEKIQAIIFIEPEILWDWLTSPENYRIGLYLTDNGEFYLSIGEDVGNEILDEELPLKWINCKGKCWDDDEILRVVEADSEYEARTCFIDSVSEAPDLFEGWLDELADRLEHSTNL